MPVRILHLLGVETLLVSNTAGGLNSNFKVGDLMIIKDHIFLPGLAGFSPFVGPHDQRFGERFVSLHEAYDPKLRFSFSFSTFTFEVIKFQNRTVRVTNIKRVFFPF